MNYVGISELLIAGTANVQFFENDPYTSDDVLMTYSMAYVSA